MAIKRRFVDGIGEVTFQKRKGARSLRIHISGSEVKVTLPMSAPYQLAYQFVLKKRDWINKHQTEKVSFRNGDLIGKSHRLEIERTSTRTIKTRVKPDTVYIQLPKEIDEQSEVAQAKIRLTAERALKLQAKGLITPRLNDLALENDFEYKSVKIKKLKRRWGSCDSSRNITINLFLAQIPWELIDYVLIHELAHTKQMNHSKQFWQIVADVIPDYKERRTKMKLYAPEAFVF